MTIILAKIWLCLLLAALIGWLIGRLSGKFSHAGPTSESDAECAGRLRSCEVERKNLLVRIADFEVLGKRSEETILNLKNRVGELLLDRWNLSNVTFPVDSAEITDPAAAALEQVLPVVKGFENVRLVINGHTDDVDSEEHNLSLSRRRAEAVREYLVDHGVATSMLGIAAHGGLLPIADNRTDEGRQKNRRIEFSIQKGV